MSATGGAAANAATSAVAGATGAATAQRVAVKFCGLCRMEDVPAFNELLPEYAGLVFWPSSKRNVSDELALQLRAALDERITTVGVFVDAELEFIARLHERGTIGVAQLHGTEDAAYIENLRAAALGLRIWKAFEVKGSASIQAANACNADFVLLDAGKGAGASFDWNLLQGMQRPYALAGGLAPGNVAAALASCNPAVLDVSSGIEAAEPATPAASASGRSAAPRKDPAKMRAFLRAARGDPSA